MDWLTNTPILKKRAGFFITDDEVTEGFYTDPYKHCSTDEDKE